MGTTVTAASDEPTPQPQFPLWARMQVRIVRFVLVFFIIKVTRNAWPLLRSRVVPALLLWILFSVYWGIAVRNSAPTKSSESEASKWFHQIVLTAALLLLFIPVPRLPGCFLPQRLHFLVVVGTILQAALPAVRVPHPRKSASDSGQIAAHQTAAKCNQPASGYEVPESLQKAGAVLALDGLHPPWARVSRSLVGSPR